MLGESAAMVTKNPKIAITLSKRGERLGNFAVSEATDVADVLSGLAGG